MSENYTAPENYPAPQQQFAPPPPPPIPPRAPVRGKSKWRFLPILGALVLGLIIGGAAAGGTKTSVSAASQPTATATTTVTAKPQPVTPASCISALSLADQGFSNASQAFTIVSQMMDDIKALDATALQGHIADLNGQTTKMQGIAGPYNAAKADCRASQ